MQYIMYYDESVKNGEFFSNFYGGALVRSIDFHEVKNALNYKKEELNFKGEVKWQKVTDVYLEKYIELVNEFFRFIQKDKIKIRIMFTHNHFLPINLTKEQLDNEYFLLYYQFFKHGFGLIHSNNYDEPISLHPFFDQLPDKKEKNQAFIDHIFKLQYDKDFRKNKIIIHKKDDIAEAKSHDHVILQCLDIVLGAMGFRLNDKHKRIPEGKFKRGKRTVAKEALYKNIYNNINQINPHFNIGITTGLDGDIANSWNHSYRHWRFRPKSFKVNSSYRSKNK